MHLEKIVAQIQALAPNKRVLIGESGWPTAGRQRGLAEPSIINAARYINNMIDSAERNGFDYNIVEAFNQPWKSEFEGVVGANWGLLSINRKPVIPLTGQVLDNPNWTIHFLLQTLLFLLIIGIFVKQLQLSKLNRLLTFIVIAQVISTQLITMSEFLWATSYSWYEISYSLFIVTANIVLSKLLLCRSIDLLQNRKSSEQLTRNLGYAYCFFAALAVLKALLLAVIGRFLSIPVEQFVIPALGLVGLAICEILRAGKFERNSLSLFILTGWQLPEEYLKRLNNGLILSIVIMVTGETITYLLGQDFVLAHPNVLEGFPVALSYTLFNKQLLAWLACLGLLSVPFMKADYRLQKSL